MELAVYSDMGGVERDGWNGGIDVVDKDRLLETEFVNYFVKQINLFKYP